MEILYIAIAVIVLCIVAGICIYKNANSFSSYETAQVVTFIAPEQKTQITNKTKCPQCGANYKGETCPYCQF